MTGAASCWPRLVHQVPGRDVSAAAHSWSASFCLQEMSTGARRRAHFLDDAVSDADGVSCDMQESLACHVSCTAGSAPLFPPGLPWVKMTATDQGCLLSMYRQLGSRELRSSRVHWTLDHLCSWSVAGKLLEYMAHQMTLTSHQGPHIQCANPQIQCDQQTYCQVSSGRPHMDHQQYHVREACSNVASTLLQATNMDTYQCYRKGQCSNVATMESRGAGIEHQTCENSSRRCYNLGKRNPTWTMPVCWPLGFHKVVLPRSEIHSNTNVNNGSDTEGKNNEQDFLTAESPLASSCVQAVEFVCDIMDTPTVLSSTHRVYHLASDPATQPVGSESSDMDSRLLTCLARKDYRATSAATKDNSRACQLARPTSCSHQCEDILSKAMSIAHVCDTDDVCGVGVLTEYSVKVEDWFLGFPEEADQLVEPVSQQPFCPDPGGADCAMSHMCAGLTLDLPPICESSAHDDPVIQADPEPGCTYHIWADPHDAFSHHPDSFSYRADEWSHRPVVWNHRPDDLNQRTETLNGGTVEAVAVCLTYEPHNPELELRHRTSGIRQQNSLSDVIDTCLQVHAPGPTHNCLCSTDSVPWSRRHSMLAEQCTFTQDVVVVKQVLELLPDTELWAGQQTAQQLEDHSQHVDMCCAANSGTSVSDINGPPTLGHSQHAELRTHILKTEETSTRLVTRGKQPVIQNKQALVGSIRGGTCPVTSPKADFIPTPGAPFSARSLCPVLQAPVTRCKSRRGRTASKSSDSASMPARGRPKGKGRGRSTALGGGCSRKRKCSPEPSKYELDTQADSTGEMEGKKAAGHVGSKKPTSRRCPTTAGKTRRANKDSSQGAGTVSTADTDTARDAGLVHADVVGDQGVPGQGFTWQKCLGTLAMDATGQPQVSPIQAVDHATEVGAMICSVTESSKDSGPGHVSVTESSREAEPVNVIVTESNREFGASSLSRFLQAKGAPIARLTQQVTSCSPGFLQGRCSGLVREAEPINVTVTESSSEAEPGNVSVTEAKPEKVSVTESSKESGPSSLSRFLQARGATVTKFTQQVNLCSPGILQGSRRGRVDNFGSRKTILTRLPKQVQHARSVQFRQVSSLKNIRGRAAPKADETDCNNHANYDTAKPMSSRESEGKDKTFSKQASADCRQTSVHRRDGDGKLVLGRGRPDRQTREEAEHRVQLPSIGPGKTVSFLDSPAVPAEKPVLAMPGSHRQTSGSTLFSIILEQLRASSDIASPQAASPPRTQRQHPAHPSQGPRFLPQIHSLCVRKVTATDISKTEAKQELKSLDRSAAGHDHLTTNVNNSRICDHQVTASRNTLITRPTQQTTTTTQLHLKKSASHREVCDPLEEKAAYHRQRCDPLGEKVQTVLARCGQHTDRLGDKQQTETQIRSHVKPVTGAGGARQASAQLENRPVLISTRQGGSWNARCQLSKRKCRTWKRDEPLKPEIAEAVRRLTVRPPSTNSRLAVMVGSWERQYGQPLSFNQQPGQPLSLNQQPGQLVEASARRRPKPSTRPSRNAGGSRVGPGSPVAHSPIHEETTRANKTPPVLADPCLDSNLAVSESPSSQGRGPAGQYGADDGPESIQLDFSPH